MNWLIVLVRTREREKKTRDDRGLRARYCGV